MQLPSENAPLSGLRHDSLPIRSASQNAAADQVVAGPRQPSAQVENRDIGRGSAADNGTEERIKKAVDDGRGIGASLADSLRQNILANDETTNLRAIVQLAEELRNFQSPVEFTIGLVGTSGVGK